MAATVLAPSCAVVVPQVLNGRGDYNDWCVRVKTYLLAEDLWDLIETNNAAKPEYGESHSESQLMVWGKKNAKALHAIQISCGPRSFALIRDKTTAKDAWDTLEEMFKLQAEISEPGEESHAKAEPGEKSKLEAEPREELHAKAELGKESQTKAEPGERSQNEAEKQIGEVSRADLDKYQPFFDAVKRGDWRKTKEFLKPHPNAIAVTKSWGTALHYAAWCGQEHIVEELVQLMTEKELEITDPFGATALSIASRISIKMIECMVRKNQKLLSIVTIIDSWPPILYAVSHEKWDIVRYLYALTPPDKGYIGATLLLFSLTSNQLDIAWELLQFCPRLLITKTRAGQTPISAYTECSGSFPSGAWLNRWQQMIYNCIHVQPALSAKDFRISVQKSENEPSTRKFSCSSILLGFLRRLAKTLLELLGINRIYELKLVHVRSLEILNYMCKVVKDLSDEEMVEGQVYDAIFTAIRSGISEFIIPLCKARPEMILGCNSKKENIFQYSIQCRQEKIYSLVYGVPQRQVLTTAPDNFENKWLHHAGMLSPLAKLDRIPGAALQMQRERQWFKEVESTSIPSRRSNINKDGVTAQRLFTETHTKLMADGEKWMKETATSCTVVGALIITVMFTAVFTVPGGNNGETGYPIFLNEKFFKVFIISDAISLFSATTSVLMFMGILTARYAEDDFLKSLPTKMIIGLSTLFISISTMMVAFCTALFVLLHDQLWAFIPIVLLASVPITLFMWMHFPLLVEMVISTFGRGIFDRNVKRWI